MFTNKEYVYEVYRELSFTRAAQNLFISQPSLSATIKKLENKIGTPIFDRSTSPISLTPCGLEYIKCAEKIMDIEDDFHNYLNDASNLLNGQISIGGSNYFTSFVLPPILKNYSAKYPDVKITITEAGSALLEEKLIQGYLDLIIDNTLFNSELYEKHLFCTDRLFLVVPEEFSKDLPAECRMGYSDILNGTYAETDFPSIDVSALDSLPFIVLKTGNNTRYRTNKLFHKYHIKPPIRLELDQQATAYHLACSGIACTIASDKLIQTGINSSNISYYKIDDDTMLQNVYLYHKKNKYITKSMETFIKLAMQ